jgi:hypothetical protein
MPDAIPFPQQSQAQPNELEACRLQLIDTQKALHQSRIQAARETLMVSELMLARCDEQRTQLVDAINARIQDDERKALVAANE